MYTQECAKRATIGNFSASYFQKLKGNPLEMLNNENFDRCHSAEKCKGGLWNLLTSILLQNIKNLKGDQLVQSKNFRKKSHSAEKNLS